MYALQAYIFWYDGGAPAGQRTRNFGAKADRGHSRGRIQREKMSIPRQAIIVPDDNTENEPGLFDDDDPFNLPPPLPPLSPQRDDDAPNQDGGGDLAAGDKKELNKKRRVNRSPRSKLDEVR